MNMKPIVDAYVRRILRGTITIDDVPDTIREDVRKALDSYRHVQNEGVGGVIATHSFIFGIIQTHKLRLKSNSLKIQVVL